jgi:PPOX class probable F420-dependent enzyme
VISDAAAAYLGPRNGCTSVVEFRQDVAMPDPVLTADQRAFVTQTRRAVLATLTPDSRPRLVPICFVLSDVVDRLGRPLLYTPIDEKSKSTPDPRGLARVRDLLVLPDATVLVDRWSEDWERLGWVRLYARGEILEPQPHERDEHTTAVAALRAKYEQYASHHLEDRPIIRLAVTAAVAWGDLTSS